MGTLFVGTVLLLIVGFVISVMIKDRKAGKNACGCKCSGCPSQGMCHSKKS